MARQKAPVTTVRARSQAVPKGKRLLCAELSRQVARAASSVARRAFAFPSVSRAPRNVGTLTDALCVQRAQLIDRRHLRIARDPRVSSAEQHPPLAERDLEQLARRIESATRAERCTNFAAMLHAEQRPRIARRGPNLLIATVGLGSVARARGLLLLALLSGCALAGCAPPGAQPKTAPAAVPSHSAPSVPWQYEVRFEGGSELAVEGHFEGDNDGVFWADEDTARFVRNVEVARGANWLPVSQRNASWSTPCSSGCSVRYRFALREAAAALARADTAIAAGDVLISPPSTWLIHPGTVLEDADFELGVEPGPGARFVSAFRPIPGSRANRYRARLAVLDDASFAAFGPLQVSEVAAGDASVQLGIAAHGLGLSRAQAEAWIAASAGAVASYYQGHLPARHALVLLMQGSGDSTRGITLGGGGPGVLVRASDRVSPSTTRDDWVVTHELLHANFPDLGPAHSWLSEGLATYIEPIARARVGLVSEAKVWRDLIDGLPHGLPQAGDEGLENTRTWGRTYWGGALFCLMADVELRESSGNQYSLDDVLLAIGKTGASDEDYWPIERVLEVAEHATSTRVLHGLFERLAKKPGTVDLAQLFERLGVRAQGDSAVFDERAPLAKLRQSITARRPG